jgi:hypothetical protein
MSLPKIFLLLDGKKLRLSLPFEGADHAVVSVCCPHCEADPFHVVGMGRRPSKDDRAWEADALSRCCEKPVGVIRYETNTLFGVREDEAVLRGRVRVY